MPSPIAGKVGGVGARQGEFATTPPLLRAVARLLREVTGEDAGWEQRITAACRLEDDLHLDSLELVALDAALCREFGPGVDLSGHIASLNLDQLIALSVGDVLALLPDRTSQAPVL